MKGRLSAAFQIDGNATQNHTLIDANSALERSNCRSTHADNRNEQQCSSVISIH